MGVRNVVLNDEISLEMVVGVTKRRDGHYWLCFMSTDMTLSDAPSFDPLVFPKEATRATWVNFPKRGDDGARTREKGKNKRAGRKVLSDPNLPSACI